MNRTCLTVVAVLLALSVSAVAEEITVPNPSFEDREVLGYEPPFFYGQDKFNWVAYDQWRHFECNDNGGPLRLWKIGDPADPTHVTTNGALDVGFGGNAPDGDYVMVARSRKNDDEFHDPPQVRDFEAAALLLTDTFDPTMTYTLTAKVGRLPSGEAEGGRLRPGRRGRPRKNDKGK